MQDGDKWKTNKFADASQGRLDASADMHIWERRLLYCTSVSFLFEYFDVDFVRLLLASAHKRDV